MLLFIRPAGGQGTMRPFRGLKLDSSGLEVYRIFVFVFSVIRICFVFIVVGCSLLLCIVFVSSLKVLLHCVMCVTCRLCPIVVLLLPGYNPIAVK
jgi:hypothetical protein